MFCIRLTLRSIHLQTSWNQHISDTETIRDVTYPAVQTAQVNVQTLLILQI